MKRNLRAALSKEFAIQLNSLEPPFVRTECDGLTPNEVCFRRSSADRRHIFVLLLFSPRGHDKFTVEMAYSKDEQFPIDLMPDLPFGMPHKGVDRGQEVDGAFRFRLGFLTPEQKDRWWSIDSELQIPEVVRALVAVIRTQGEVYCRGQCHPGELP